MKVLFLCGRETSYTRNSTLLKAFSNSCEVTNITSSNKKYIPRLISTIFKFIFNSQKYDIVFVGFYGQILVPIVRLFTNKPIIFDAYISTYQTLCFDRKKFAPESIIGKVAYYIDKLSCKLASTVILDTNAHIDYFVRTFNLNKNKFSRIFVGADESLFYFREASIKDNSEKLVFFYCEYQPLHGVQYIVKAAKLLENEHIKFKLVGKGKEKENILNLVKDIQVKNIEFVDWVQYKNLPDEINKADICLAGHFGNTEKGNLVIAGKTFQFIAMKKPTLIAKNSANEELFGENKSYFVRPADEKDLSDKIKYLFDNPDLMKQISEEQYEIYNKVGSNKVIFNQIAELIKKYEN